MPVQTNRIKIKGDGNIVIQDIHGSEITINAENATDILSKLQELNDNQLEVLSQIVEKEHHKIGEIFKTLLKGIVAQKNIVTGNHISNIRDLKVGDETHYHYTIHVHRKPSRILFPFLYKKTLRIWGDANSILQALIKESGYDLSHDFPTLNEVESIFNSINPNHDAPLYLGDRKANWVEFFGFYTDRNENLINKLLSENLDNEFRLKLRELEDNSFMQHLKLMGYTRKGPFRNTNLSWIHRNFHKYLVAVFELKTYAETNFK